MKLFARGALMCLLLTCTATLVQAQTLYTFPDQGFTPVYNFMKTATKTLDMTMYELVDTTAQNDLIALAGKGVTVRVILDQNDEKSNNTAAYNALTNGGVQCHWANTTYPATHQKTITVDGKSSLILTANLTSRYYSTTRDFAITDTDAKDVGEIEYTFNKDFTNATVTPYAEDALIWSPNLATTDLLGIINGAKHTLYLENEEISASNIVSALVKQAEAGVSVTLVMTNDDNDYASEFETLTKAGVKVYTYPDNSTALYIHAKAIVADYNYTTAIGYVGSINFSTASMTENRELGVYVSSTSVLSSLYNTIVADANGGTLWTQTS